MAFIEIPVRADLPDFNERIELDGTVYVLAFRWNSRMERWIMDVKDSDGVMRLAGLVIHGGAQVNRQFVSGNRDGVPPGAFLVRDTTGQLRDPDLETFGKDVKLFYAEAA